MKNYQNIVADISKTYLILSEGKCINIKRNREVVFPLDKKGYPKARIWAPEISKNKDRRIPIRLHRLVAMFFLKDFDSKFQVNHKNGIKTDNQVENLEMVNSHQNVWHGWNVLDSKQRRIRLGEKVKQTARNNFEKNHKIIKCDICEKETTKWVKNINKKKNWKRYCSWKCFMASKQLKPESIIIK